MANWQVYEVKSRTPKVQKLYGKWTLGASGAVASQDCDGFTVTKESTAGQYTLALDERFNSLLHVSLNFLDAADFSGWRIESEDVDGSDPAVTVQFFDVDGSPGDANLSSGTVIFAEITLKNTNL